MNVGDGVPSDRAAGRGLKTPPCSFSFAQLPPPRGHAYLVFAAVVDKMIVVDAEIQTAAGDCADFSTVADEDRRRVADGGKNRETNQ